MPMIKAATSNDVIELLYSETPSSETIKQIMEDKNLLSEYDNAGEIKRKLNQAFFSPLQRSVDKVFHYSRKTKITLTNPLSFRV